MAKKTKNTFPFLATGLILLGTVFILKKKTATIKGIGSFSTKYFVITNETNIDDLKKQYYRLAKVHHPDTGGSNEAFKEMNNEYELLQNIILKNGNFTDAEQTNEQNISEIYRDIIDSIITIQGIVIELIGSWIWISGNTYPVKEQIKAAGFKFHSKKSMWFWYPGEYRKHNNTEMDIEDIRNRYGSKEIKSNYERGTYKLSGISGLAEKLEALQSLLVKRENLNKAN